ncbi:MAG TPA: hypothetical protein VF531_16135 [Bacillota bacterium]
MQTWYRKAWRIISQPYAFFEETINCGNTKAATITFVGALLLVNLGWLAVTRESSPAFWVCGFLLPLLSYPAAVFIIYLICRILVRETKLRSFFAVWGFSFLPTGLFFLLNIVTHILITIPGFGRFPSSPVFMLIFWTLIILIFLWKALFLAITLRLAGNLNFRQMIPAFILLGLIAGGYWWVTSGLGWLKIPFI